MAAWPPLPPHLDRTQRQIQIIMGHNQISGFRIEVPEKLRDGLSRTVHVGERLD